MAAMIMSPQFHEGEKVKFLGGVGTIKNHRLESGSWTYWVEMDMGPEPEMGRVGYETMIVLTEADILS